jgi:hypothetical protein
LGYDFNEEFKEHFQLRTIDEEISKMIELIGQRIDCLVKLEPDITIEEVD